VLTCWVAEVLVAFIPIELPALEPVELLGVGPESIPKAERNDFPTLWLLSSAATGCTKNSAQNATQQIFFMLLFPYLKLKP
jgi:hypothetical protein